VTPFLSKVVFESEAEAFEGVVSGRVKRGDVMVVRGEGPRGAPGMPEMLSPSAALVGAGLGKVTKGAQDRPKK
jgi:dihydroxy-acid dehydratase